MCMQLVSVTRSRKYFQFGIQLLAMLCRNKLVRVAANNGCAVYWLCNGLIRQHGFNKLRSIIPYVSEIEYEKDDWMPSAFDITEMLSCFDFWICFNSAFLSNQDSSYCSVVIDIRCETNSECTRFTVNRINYTCMVVGMAGSLKLTHSQTIIALYLWNLWHCKTPTQ